MSTSNNNIVNGKATTTTKTRAPRKSSTKTAAAKAAQPKEAIMSTNMLDVIINVNGSFWKRIKTTSLDWQSNKHHFTCVDRDAHMITKYEAGPKDYELPILVDQHNQVQYIKYEYTVIDVTIFGLEPKKVCINYDGSDFDKAWEILMNAQTNARESFYALKNKLPKINYTLADPTLVPRLKKLMTRDITVLTWRQTNKWCFTDVRVKDDPYEMPGSRTSGSAEAEVVAKPGK